jgi:DNA polymerase I-like protein with 3'-5' exonuclease and polymerase domains
MAQRLHEIDAGDVAPKDVIAAAIDRGVFVFDLETTGLNWREDRIEGIAIHVPDSNTLDELSTHFQRDGKPVRAGKAISAWYPFVDYTVLMYVQPEDPDEEPVLTDLRPAMDQRSTMEALRPLFENYPDLVAIAHHGKFDESFMLEASGADAPIKINCHLGDSMLLDFLGDENHKRYGLKPRVKALFGHDMTTYEDAAKLKRQQVLPFMADRVQPLGIYAMQDVYWTWRLFDSAFRRLMKEDSSGKLERIYWNIDMKIARLLREMECQGVLIDWKWLHHVASQLQDQKDAILEQIEQRIGWTLNPNSSPQVATLLFGPKGQGNLGLPTKAVAMGEGGIYKTGNKEIGHLRRADPIVADILKWRSHDTVQKSFAIKIAKIAREEGRLHSHFNQTGTKIFRLSCISGTSDLSIRVGNEPYQRSTKIAELLQFAGRDIRIFTHRRRERRITDVINKGPGFMFDVRTDDGREIRCTAEHRFLTPSGWGRLSELAVGAILTVPGDAEPCPEVIAQASRLVASRPDACYAWIYGDLTADGRLRHGGGGYDSTLVRIASITPVGVEDVWDISVEDDESYAAHGFYNHNSSDPVNLQNQPRDRNLIRKAFCAHLPEEAEAIAAIMDPVERERRERMQMVLLGADYGQVELRVAAHLSGDKGMIEVYKTGKPCTRGSENGPCERYQMWVCESKLPDGSYCEHLWNPGDEKPTSCPKCGGDKVEHQKRCRHVDLHQRTAEDVGVPRNPLAKNLNFGSLYRIGAYRFCQYADLYDKKGEPRVSYAETILDGWYSAYPAITVFHHVTEAYLKENGWLAKTITGRRRRLSKARLENEYKAITQGIQFQVSGSAQDILKVGMIRIADARQRKIDSARPAERRLWQQVRFLIQVHDEIILESPRVLAPAVSEIIKVGMEGAANLRVPLTVDVKTGRVWDDIH